MDVNAEKKNGVLILKVGCRRIDSSNSRDFQSKLEFAVKDEDAGVVLDFGDVTYISSAGMRVILSLLKILQKKNSKLVICDMRGSVREVFSISGFDKIVDIRDSQDEAITACSA